MAAYYWIKLYDEILDDPKMGRLSDGAFRLAINLFLLAGRQDDRDGRLPDVEDIAWTLRLSPEVFSQQWQELERADIVHLSDGDPTVTNFEKRQQALSPAEKQKRYRDRKRAESLQDDNPTVTDGVTESNTDIDKDIDKEQERPLPPSEKDISIAIKNYEQEIGPITMKSQELVIDSLESYGLYLVVAAIDEAVRSNVRKWSYVEGILKNWGTNGRGGNGANGQASPNGLWDSQVMAWIRNDRAFNDLDPPVQQAIRQMGGDSIKTMNTYQLKEIKEQFNRRPQ
jgi:DnaD/phage-associated family protein